MFYSGFQKSHSKSHLVCHYCSVNIHLWALGVPSKLCCVFQSPRWTTSLPWRSSGYSKVTNSSDTKCHVLWNLSRAGQSWWRKELVLSKGLEMVAKGSRRHIVLKNLRFSVIGRGCYYVSICIPSPSTPPLQLPPPTPLGPFCPPRFSLHTLPLNFPLPPFVTSIRFMLKYHLFKDAFLWTILF